MANHNITLFRALLLKRKADGNKMRLLLVLVLLAGTVFLAPAVTPDPLCCDKDTSVQHTAAEKRLCSHPRFLIAMAVAKKPIGGKYDQLFGIELLAGILYHIDATTGTYSIVNRELVSPHGIALYQNEAGTIHEAYITEILPGRLVRVDLITGEKQVVCSGLTFPARLAVASLSAGIDALFVTELFSGSLVRVKIKSDGTCQQETIAAGLDMPDGVMIEPGGATVLISSFLGRSFFRKTKSGKVVRVRLSDGTVLDTIAEGQLLFPVCFDGAQDGISFFVSQMGGRKINKITPNEAGWQIEDTFSGLCTPSGIGLSHDGKSLFAAECLRSRVVKIDLATAETTTVVMLPRPKN